METRPPVLLLGRSPANLRIKDRLSSHFILLDASESQDPTSSLLSGHSHLVRALVCIGLTPITAETFSLLPALELIVASSAGIEHIDTHECHKRGIIVTNASVAFAEDAADYAVASLIGVLRKISAADRFVRSSSWPLKGDYPLGFKLGGKRVGIVGFGSVGCQVAKRLDAFGCKIAYNSRSQKPCVPFPFYANVVDLAADSDVLILCCPLSAQTYHIINDHVMQTLGKQGVIINIGRGSLINEKELVQVLMEGKIGGAGLDVFENEPVVPMELLSLDNVVLSPHQAVLTPEAFEAVIELTLSNLKAFFSNEPLQSVVQLL